MTRKTQATQKTSERSYQFHSPTLGEVSLDELLQRIRHFMEERPSSKYHIVIGSDSEGRNHAGVSFVTALVVHRVGGGGIYFWTKEVSEVHSLRERILREATLSLEFIAFLLPGFVKYLGRSNSENSSAGSLTAESGDKKVFDYDLEIHVDIGREGETRAMIREVVGMIRGSGFDVKTKPDSYCASSVADKYAR